MKRHLLIFLILLAAGTAMAQSHVSDLVVTPASGGTIKWYDDATGGTVLYPITTTIHTGFANRNETTTIKILPKFRIFSDSEPGLNR